MAKISCILFLGLVALSLNAMSETYKCRSPDGKISYAGQMSLAPGVKCEQIFVKKQAVVVQEAPPPDVSTPEADTGGLEPANAIPAPTKKPDIGTTKTDQDNTKKKTEKTIPEKSAADKQAEQKIKDENCQSAKANLRTYQVGGRIGKVNENGERVLMDDTEVKQKAQDAQALVDKWCNS